MKPFVLKRRLMTIPFPATGCLFYRKGLKESQPIVPISGQSDQVPTVQYEWWYRGRSLFDVGRGPSNLFFTVNAMLPTESLAEPETQLPETFESF
jgi:hypothetical protein